YDWELPLLTRGEEQDHRDDGNHTRGQTVGAVEEVDGVLHTDEPEDADRHRDWKRELYDATAREADIADLEIEDNNSQEGQSDLDCQLDHGTHRPAVVDDEQSGHETRDHHQAQRLEIAGREDCDRDRETEPHRKPAEERRRAAVGVTPAGLGDQAQTRRNANGNGRGEYANHKSKEERPQPRQEVVGDAGERLVA